MLQAAKRFGWVRRVNAAGRTAAVAWVDGGADTEHSVYQLQVGFGVRWFCQAWAGPSWGHAQL